MSPTKEGKTEACASCGKPHVNRIRTDVDDVPLCGDCTDRLLSGHAVSFFATIEEGPPPPAEERFGALFKTARTLLEQGGAEEDQIIPTLAFANELGQGDLDLDSFRRRLVEATGDAEKWERVADEFVSRYGGLRPVHVVNGVVILERLPVSVRVKTDPDEATPVEVSIIAHWHRRPASPEHVEQLYERALSNAGVSYDEQRRGRPGFDIAARGLMITVQNGAAVERSKRRRLPVGITKASFLHPRVVREFYRMLLGSSSGDGFARHLAVRTRGISPFADNLVPACVAFYFKEYGDIEDRGEIHRLLNEHVLRDTYKSLPVDAFGSSKTNQLWRDVRKVGQALCDCSHTLFWGWNG